MSRTRMIKPSFFKHAELYEAERGSGLPLRIAFAGLWTVADREGRFKWKSDLKPDILPYDPVNILDVLSALERAGFVRRYVVDGKEYGLIPTFAEHQTFHKTERASTLPPPLANGEHTVKHTADAVTVTGTVTDTVTGSASSTRADAAAAELTALDLCVWANSAVAEKWGESTRPYTQGSAVSLLQALLDAQVPPSVAQESIYRQCRESNRRERPNNIGYFRPGVLDDWDAEQTRRAAVARGESPPSVAQARHANGNGKSTWQDEFLAEAAAKAGK